MVSEHNDPNALETWDLMAEPTYLIATGEKTSAAILDELTMKMQQALIQTHTSAQPPTSDNYSI